MSGAERNAHVYDVVVIGGGAAGVGVGVALKHAGIENFIILERLMIGASFLLWPSETRFITPSFPSNSIGMLDLNAVALGASPAFLLKVEHPSGEQFATHLNAVAEFYKLPVRSHAQVKKFTKPGQIFRMAVGQETLRAKHVVWAAGEFQFPSVNGFPGSDLCRHTATIPSYAELEGQDAIVIGGCESGFDAAYHLAQRNTPVRLFDTGCPWESESSDPSVGLSTFSLERARDPRFVEQVQLFPRTTVASVAREGNQYTVTTVDDRSFQTSMPPLLAAGFEGSHKLIPSLFERRDDGYPLLTEHDESTITSGLFLCGPAVRHDNHIFCFIYKYRQRFAVVAKAIATSLGLEAEGLENYRKWGMYLDDLSCCGEECAC